jgi:hypothetical protein
MGWTQNPPVLGTLQVRFLFPAPSSNLRKKLDIVQTTGF